MARAWRAGTDMLMLLTGDGLYMLYRMRTDGSDLHAVLGPSTFLSRHIDWGPASGR